MIKIFVYMYVCICNKCPYNLTDLGHLRNGDLTHAAPMVGPTLGNCGIRWEMVGWHANKKTTWAHQFKKVVGPTKNKVTGPLLEHGWLARQQSAYAAQQFHSVVGPTINYVIGPSLGIHP